MTHEIEVHELGAVDSTQDEVRMRLDAVAPGACVAVSARSQRAGRGREGRRWENPPGGALLLSVGRRGPLAVTVLDDLPRRIAEALLRLLGPGIVWKPPNDLVTATDGAKVAGILVDARSTGMRVDEVIIGVGINLSGPEFVTSDGRAATGVDLAGGLSVPLSAILATLLHTPSRS